MRGKSILLGLSFLLAAALLTACGSSSPQPAASAAQTPASAAKAPGAKTPSPKAAAATPTPAGDGTVRIRLNLLNPEKQQDKYSVFFTRTGAVQKGKALTPLSFVGPFVADVAGELTVDIKKDLQNFLYRNNSVDSQSMSADLVVARVEDSHVRNPLSSPLKLDFAGLLTTDKGNELTVDVTDSALNDLYPQEVLLVKVVPEKIQDGGGYPTIYYGKSGQMQRGSAGPDFLVAFPVEEFQKKGIKEAKVVILDDNQPRSEPVHLTFDENGRCEQGPLVIIKTNR